MLVKIYWTVWAVMAFGAAMIFLAGYFTAVVGVAFGFIAFGVVFMGMIAVLPAMVSHPAPRKRAAAPTHAAHTETPVVGEAFAGGVLRSA